MRLIFNATSGDHDPRALAATVEAAGFDGVSCADHFFRNDAYPHVWVTLTAMAMATARITVGSAFANNLFRSPVEFAQASLTLQRISGNRFEAGLGAGWLAAEVTRAGLVYPEPALRARRYREAVAIVRELFTTGRCCFEGEFYNVDVPVVPACDRPPPLIVSLGGPWTIRNIAPLADRVELKFGQSTRGGALDLIELARATREDLVRMIDEVRAVAAEVPIGAFTMIAAGAGAEVEQLQATLGDSFYGQFVGEPARVLDNLLALEALGIDRVQVADLVKGSALLLPLHPC